MGNGKNRRTFRFHDEEHTERKPVKDGAAKIPKDNRETQWTFFDPSKCRAKFTQKLDAKSFSLVLVPGCGFKHIELGLRPNIEPSHLPFWVEALLDAVEDLWPRPRVFGILAMCREAFLE